MRALPVILGAMAVLVGVATQPTSAHPCDTFEILSK
jgi:hypothetical protein